jgi:CRISPR-associated protein Csc3
MTSENNFDNYPEIPDLANYDDEEEKDTPVKRELLTISLFKKAIQEAPENAGDDILTSFAENVLPNLVHQLVGATAKGGQFTEDRRAEGKNVERSKHDQSLLSHLLNGLFPTYRIIRKLKSSELGTNPVKRQCGEQETRLFVAAYILHDFEKFPDYPIWLEENDLDGVFANRDWRNEPAKKSDAPNLRRGYVKQKIQDFSLDIFLGEDWEKCIDDIVWLSSNAGDGSDADRGLEIRGLQPRLDGRVRNILHRLLKMSDLFASLLKHPRDVESDGRNEKLPELLNDVSNGQLKFSYHALSDNRGVLTNIINNALMDVHPKQYYTPLLYLPDGVVYLAVSDAPPINTAEITNQVVDKIYQLCKGQIESRLIGVNRDDMKRRIKLAPYISLLFTPQEIVARIVPKAVFKWSQKLDNLGETLVDKQNRSQAPKSVNFDKLVFDGKVDRLGKLLALISFIAIDKDGNLALELLEHLGLSHFIEDFGAFSDSGGTIYRYFYIASRFYETKLGISPDEERSLIEELAQSLSEKLNLRLQPDTNDNWRDLRTYVNQVISLPTGAAVKPKPDQFLMEFNRYNAAKVTGRGRENVCSISSSSYTVTEQKETATLFAPQVYSNRQILFNTQAAKRQICSIWSIEIMLRQIMMSKTDETGGDFENRKIRYLYLYPAYFGSSVPVMPNY